MRCTVPGPMASDLATSHFPDFDVGDVLPLESRRTNQIIIIHTQPTPAPHETSAAHCIGAGSPATPQHEGFLRTPPGEVLK